MKRFLTLLIYLFSISYHSYAQTPGNTIGNPALIVKDVMSLLVYQQAHLSLADDFLAFNSRSKQISKGQFLKALTTGLYLPLQFDSRTGRSSYKLYKLNSTVNPDVKQTIVQTAENYLRNYKLEGQKFPSVHFVGLNGKVYTPQTTKDKILVLNSWFIKCQACNEEMPALNNLVERYRNRKDILFVGISFDNEGQLRQFLKKKKFEYAIASVNKKFIEQFLHSNIYPTHWLVNKKGVIVKVVNDPDEIISAVNKEAL